MQYLEQLKWRYATKQFDTDKKIDDDTWNAIEDSLVLTPSSFGLQPWKFVVVTDPELKHKLREHSWGQAQVTECSHFLILCAKDDINPDDINALLEDTVATRGGQVEDLQGYGDIMRGFVDRMSDEEKFQWAKNQVYIALGQLMATAAALEIDACPMEGIVPPEFDRILNLEGYKTVVACAMGFRATDDHYAELAKVRFTKEALIQRG